MRKRIFAAALAALMLLCLLSGCKGADSTNVIPAAGSCAMDILPVQCAIALEIDLEGKTPVIIAIAVIAIILVVLIAALVNVLNKIKQQQLHQQMQMQNQGAPFQPQVQNLPTPDSSAVQPPVMQPPQTGDTIPPIHPSQQQSYPDSSYQQNQNAQPAHTDQDYQQNGQQQAQHSGNGGFRIQGIGGTFGNRRFAVNGNLRMGRDPARSDLTYPPETKGISGAHCVLVSDGQHLFLQDVGSTYGTYVNGSRIASHQNVELHKGDRFALGSEQQSFFVDWKD